MLQGTAILLRVATYSQLLTKWTGEDSGIGYPSASPFPESLTPFPCIFSYDGKTAKLRAELQ
jgi:hypothetical protein